MIRLLLIIVGLLSFVGTSFAASIPFTDVQSTDSYYSAVSELYSARIISDDGSHLFRPSQPMTRDFFTSLIMMVGCTDCLKAAPEMVSLYQINPFIDIRKSNPYYYCIAEAKTIGITQGYILDQTQSTTCEDGTRYTSSPFCPLNSTSRIEATAMLLRRANLWNDTLNSDDFDRSIAIPDATEYWYGYAKK
jgi:S-layer homology domain